MSLGNTRAFFAGTANVCVHTPRSVPIGSRSVLRLLGCCPGRATGEERDPSRCLVSRPTACRRGSLDPQSLPCGPPPNSHNAQASHSPTQPPHRGFACRMEAHVDATEIEHACRLQLHLCGGSPQLRVRCGVCSPRPCTRAQTRAWSCAGPGGGSVTGRGDQWPSLRVTMETLFSLRLWTRREYVSLPVLFKAARASELSKEWKYNLHTLVRQPKICLYLQMTWLST